MRLIETNRSKVVVNLTEQEITVDGCTVYNGLPNDANAPSRGRRRTQFTCDGIVIDRTFEGLNKFAAYINDMDSRCDLFINEVYHIVDNELAVITEEIIGMLDELNSPLVRNLDYSLYGNATKPRRSRRTFGMNDSPRGSASKEHQ